MKDPIPTQSEIDYARTLRAGEQSNHVDMSIRSLANHFARRRELFMREVEDWADRHRNLPGVDELARIVRRARGEKP